MATNPYASIAIKDDNPYASIAVKDNQPATAPPAATPWYSQVLPIMSNVMQLPVPGDVMNGAIEGLGSTLDHIGHVIFPDAAARAVGLTPPTKQQEAAYFAPANMQQKVGKGLEQAGEFLIPGGAEEAGAAKLADLMPGLGRLAPIAGRTLAGAASGGLVNGIQGQTLGSAGLGAVTGAAGGALGGTLKALAPDLAEGALGIRKLDRGYGRTPGKTILEETTALSPGKIGDQAQSKLDVLNPQLNDVVDAASVKPAPRIAGFLPPPAEEMSLASTGGRNPRMRPMAFDAEVNPENPFEPRSGDPMAPISDYPGINPHYLSGSEHPELSGRVPVVQGTVMHQPAMDMSITPSQFLPTEMPNTIASLSPARQIVADAMGTAKRQNAAKTTAQLQPIQDFLTQRFNTGESIPENITPRDLLDLKRGLRNDFVSTWNPEISPGVTGVARDASHAMATQLHDLVPETKDLDSRIMNLIPVAQRGASTDLNAGISQRVFNRIGRPTGALIGAATGMGAGYHEGGLHGAAIGGLAGLLGPEILANPAVQMGVARSMYSPITGQVLRPLVGAGLQFTRKQDQ